MLLRPEHRVERRRDELDAARRTLPHMAARMEIVEIPRRRLETREIIRERLPRERPQRLLRRAGVQRIRRVRDDRPEALRAGERAKRRHILRSERLRAAAARIAREKRERIRAERDRLAPHRLVALRGRHMRPDVKCLHPVSSPQACAPPAAKQAPRAIPPLSYHQPRAATRRRRENPRAAACMQAIHRIYRFLQARICAASRRPLAAPRAPC